ncbi:PLP-dependent aminotransferase family protein [Xylanimonas allomyrinae]|uniref:aminotransferase-like domain-containing protein n=1 Tax=Xylanimonas allomyrinae TaxID=2509459 RepID=UPI001FEACE90|nr:pyridoxal phosphate-dependent aminotransferase [Xylanimonas allomyrinae]
MAARYAERGTPTSADQILVTTGAQHAIALLARTFLRPRDTVVVQDPTYVHALEAVWRAGGRLVGVPCPAGDALDVEQFASALRQSRPRLAYLVTDFHNPTGQTLTPAQKAAAREAAQRFGVTVLGDETLTELTLDADDGAPATDADVPPSFSGPGTGPHVISIGSASKTFWGGLRIGWVRAHPDVVAALAQARGSLDIASPLLDQLAVVELLARRAEVLAGRRVTLRAQRDVLVDGLRAGLPWDVPRPAGGLSVWPSLGAPLAHAFAAAAAAEGVLVNAGPTFSPHASAADRVRLTFGRSTADLERALPRLVRAWARVAR